MKKVAFAPELPKSIWSLINHAIATLDPMQVILYGSRARGDANENSDYDLAFEFSPEKSMEWTSFKLDSQELPITLRRVDLLALHEVSGELAQRIKEEGIVLYERKTQY